MFNLPYVIAMLFSSIKRTLPHIQILVLTTLLSHPDPFIPQICAKSQACKRKRKPTWSTKSPSPPRAHLSTPPPPPCLETRRKWISRRRIPIRSKKRSLRHQHTITRPRKVRRQSIMGCKRRTVMCGFVWERAKICFFPF